MRVLIVEDDPSIYELVEDIVTELLPGREIAVASDKSSALQAIDEAEAYELLICDLKVPTSSVAADASEAHGLAVHSQFSARFPGVPVIFLSGFAADNAQILTDLVGAGGQTLILPDDDPIPLVQLSEKANLVKFRSRLEGIAQRLNQVDALALESTDDVPEVDKRIMRLALAYQSMKKGRVKLVHGGMAGSRTYRLDGFGAGSEVNVQLFVKVDTATSVQDERNRFQLHVPGRLRPGAYASFVAHIGALSGGQQALVFRFGDYVTGSAFDNLPKDGAGTVRSIREAVAPWQSAGADGHVSVGDLRARRFSDEFMEATGLLARPDAARIESSSFDAPVCICHGDLHGDNALMSGASACLIDFGDVELALSCIDPITLEMSLWTHRRGRELSGGWPTTANASRWWDLDAYLAGCPHPEFVTACREWAWESAGGDERCLVAVVYSHSLRQLKYDDTSDELAMAFVDGALARWRELS